MPRKLEAPPRPRQAYKARPRRVSRRQRTAEANLRTDAYSRIFAVALNSCVNKKFLLLRPFFTLAGFIAPLLLQAQTQPTWTIVNHGLDAGYTELTNVAFGNGVFVAVAAPPTPSGTAPAVPVRIATSTDGLTWTARSINNTLFRPYISRVRFLNGRFVVAYGGQTAADFGSSRADFFATSTDGVTWTNVSQPSTGGFTELIFANGRYYAVGSEIRSTTDFTAWTTHPTSLAGIFSYLDIAFGNGRFFATTNGAGGTVTSTDGTTWTQVPFFAQLGGYRVEFLNGTWFFYSQGNNAVSTDGTTFSTVTRALTTPGGTSSILAVNGRYLAPGIGNYQASIDGRDWAQFGNWPTIAGSFFNSYFEVAFGVGRYVAVGSSLAGGTYRPLVITLAEADAPALVFPVAPAITTAPASANAVIGRSATFSVVATGAGNTFQWRKDNVAIAGATAATYTIAAVTAASAGSYTVVVTNSLGTVTSAPAVLSLVPAAQIGRIANVSVRTTLAAEQILIVGFNMAGGGAKDVLVRAAGPGLGALGVPGTMPDPRLTVFNGSTQIATNDNWSGNAAVASAISSLGAFPFPSADSRDAALVTRVDGGRTVHVSGAVSGNLIVEAYDAGSGPAPRFTSVSARNRSGPGPDVLIAGFTITGSTNINVLIRGVGPSLAAAPFNLGGTLADPKLEIYNSAQTKIAENDTWASTLTPTFDSLGAFRLVAGSRDAAVIVNLAPGNYTAQVAGADGGSGEAIIELYELP